MKRDSLAAAAVGEEEGLELDDEEAEEVGEEWEGASPRGRWTEMALRRQLSHCCLWKMSLTCSVCDCAWPGSCERTRKMFLAAGGEEKKKDVSCCFSSEYFHIYSSTFIFCIFYISPHLCLHCRTRL